jgi:hypothetical protein
VYALCLVLVDHGQFAQILLNLLYECHLCGQIGLNCPGLSFLDPAKKIGFFDSEHPVDPAILVIDYFVLEYFDHPGPGEVDQFFENHDLFVP